MARRRRRNRNATAAPPSSTPTPPTRNTLAGPMGADWNDGSVNWFTRKDRKAGDVVYVNTSMGGNLATHNEPGKGLRTETLPEGTALTYTGRREGPKTANDGKDYYYVEVVDPNGNKVWVAENWVGDPKPATAATPPPKKQEQDTGDTGTQGESKQDTPQVKQPGPGEEGFIGPVRGQYSSNIDPTYQQYVQQGNRILPGGFVDTGMSDAAGNPKYRRWDGREMTPATGYTQVANYENFENNRGANINSIASQSPAAPQPPQSVNNLPPAEIRAGTGAGFGIPFVTDGMQSTYAAQLAQNNNNLNFIPQAQNQAYRGYDTVENARASGMNIRTPPPPDGFRPGAGAGYGIPFATEGMQSTYAAQLSQNNNNLNFIPQAQNQAYRGYDAVENARASGMNIQLPKPPPTIGPDPFPGQYVYRPDTSMMGTGMQNGTLIQFANPNDNTLQGLIDAQGWGGVAGGAAQYGWGVYGDPAKIAPPQWVSKPSGMPPVPMPIGIRPGIGFIPTSESGPLPPSGPTPVAAPTPEVSRAMPRIAPRPVYTPSIMGGGAGRGMPY